MIRSFSGTIQQQFTDSEEVLTRTFEAPLGYRIVYADVVWNSADVSAITYATTIYAKVVIFRGMPEYPFSYDMVPDDAILWERGANLNTSGIVDAWEYWGGTQLFLPNKGGRGEVSIGLQTNNTGRDSKFRYFMLVDIVTEEDGDVTPEQALFRQLGE